MATTASTRFAVTCGLLRQYMREHQQQPPAPAVSLLATEAAAEGDDGRTMQLFPTRDAAAVEAAETAPLTIFYGGRMVVFEDVTAEKAMELVRMAAASDSSPPAPAPATPPQPAALSDMPIARKASLQRFLQKRKHRITTTSDPYKKPVTASPEPEKSFAAVKPVKDEPATWLGL
uniref:Protein TIFY n=1 Tax=Leersia perrieri TaxID=77586 RepID=A0A0D9XJA6_9ORYZ